MVKAKEVVTRKFEDFTGEWGSFSQSTGLKYVVFIDGVCWFEYKDGHLEIDAVEGMPSYKSQWTIEIAEDNVKTEYWREVFEGAE